MLRISAVRPGRVDFSDLRYHRSAQDHASYVVRRGDLLIVRYNGNAKFVAACGMVRDAVNGCLYPDKLIRIRVDPAQALPEYVELAMLTPEARRQLEPYIKTAAGQHGISGRDLRRLVITLPPLAEQHRIVTRIEALFARTRRARADLERIAALARRYLSATLTQAFQGTLTDPWRAANNQPAVHHPIGHVQGPYEVPAGWAWCPLPSLGELARGKSRHRPRNHPALYGGPYPFIQTGDVRAARGRLSTFQQTYTQAGLAQSRLWPRDTLCITIAANIAETAILDIEACFPDSVVGFRAKRGLCLPEYIEYFFRTAKEDLAAFAPATAQKNINLETLEAVLVPTPGLQEQAECVRLLSRSEAAAQVCENEAARAIALLDRLEQSILARAFRGELVPQDAADSVPDTAPVVESITPVSPRRGRRAAA